MSDNNAEEVFNFDLPDERELADAALKIGGDSVQAGSQHQAIIEPGAPSDEDDERAVVSSAKPKSSANLMIIGVVVATVAS